ncbi:STAS domain-containing protein [Streptomyces sp. NPDC051041]|uniref:STAS domain-containing protein n=1 Tax=Streptomyces sp. NPDC051041 TaxID=3365640 RepID=UPI0037AEDB50
MTEIQHTLSLTRHDRPAGLVLLEVAGELDHHTAPRLTAALDDVTFDAGTRLVIDLTELTYCDSTGITVLVTAYNRATAAGASLSLAGVNPDLLRVFHVVGLDQVFTFHPTVDDALAPPHS